MVAIRLDIPKALKVTLAGTRGFTLVEVVIALGLLSLATGMIGGGLFQVHGIQKFWRDDAVATRELRHAGSWFAGDALNAESVLTSSPPGGTPLPCAPDSPSNSVTLTWTDSNSSHVATYTVSGKDLNRTYDGATIRLAERVIAQSADAQNTGFSLCNKLLTLYLAVDADRGDSESMSLKTLIRKLD